MSLIGASSLDLIDKYRRENPDGTVADVIEILSQLNPILQDGPMVECNLGTRHKTTTRSGLPSVTWGKLYQGIAQSKSNVVSVEDTTGFVEGLSSVDERVLQLGDESKLRLSEAMSFLEAIAQEVATRIFYGNSQSSPEQFLGLAPRYNSLSAPNGNNIVDAGGTGSDNTSIWLIGWGDHATHLLYPKGTQAGVTREDMGRQRVLDSNGNPYFVKEELFRQHIGLSLRDWRYTVRVANIDVSDMRAGSVKVYDYLRKAYWKMQSRRSAKPGGANGNVAMPTQVMMYCNRDVLEALDRFSSNSGSADNFVRLTPMQVEGIGEVLTYRGIPIRESDALVNTETRVV